VTKEVEMASVINTNMASLYAQKNLSRAQDALATSVERLSSGLRINRAKDDAAGLGISQVIQSQVRALNQGIRNANDAVSMVQTAEGSLSEVSNILQRMKELAVQGRNDSLSSTQRQYIADELVALRKEINAIAERTTYNGMSLLKNALRSQVGSTLADTGMFAEGAQMVSGVSVKNLKVDTANVGTYSFSVRNEVVESGFSAASNINQEPVPTVDADGQPIGANSVRTISIAEGDVFEGGRLSITIKGAEGDIVYSAVAGQDSTAETLADQLVAKLSRDYSDSVSAAVEDGQARITFSENAGVGIAKIDVSLSILEGEGSVANLRSRVDSPVANDSAARTITLNDFDIREGRLLTVRVGNPNTYAQFSTYVGAGADKSSVAQDLVDLIAQKYTGVSLESSADGSNVITFSSDANLGQAAISLTIQDTKETKSSLTISSVSDAYGTTAQDRSIEIVDADVDPGRVFNLSIDGKNYSYKAVKDDTASSVAYALSTQLAKDYASVDGTVSADDITVTATEGGSTVSGAAANVAVTFRALSAGEVFSVGSLDFTANRNVTASELADAFAEISSGGSGGSVAYGSFAGALEDADGNAYYSGAKVTSGANYVVTFTAETAGTSVDPADLAVAITNTEASSITVSAAATDGATAGQGSVSVGVTIGSSDAGTDAITTATAHGLATGDALKFDSTTAGNLADNATYYAIVTGASTFQVAASQANAFAATEIALAGTEAGTFMVTSDVDLTDEVITKASHGFVTGDRVVYSTSNTAITGLTGNASYYVIKVGTDEFQLATSLENALAGTAINLTGAGEGIQTFKKYGASGTTTAADEQTTVSISRAGGLIGDQVTIDGLTLTLTSDAAGAEIAEAFANYQRFGTTTSIGSFSGQTSGRYDALLSSAPFAPVSIAAATVTPTTNTFTENAHGFVDGDKVLYQESTNPPIHGLVDGEFYYVIQDDANTFRLASSYGNVFSSNVASSSVASADGVDVAANTLTDEDHSLVTGDRVVYTAGTTAIGGLTTATNYYVIKVDDDTYKLATTRANAFAGTAIDLTSAGVGSQGFDKPDGTELDVYNTGAETSTVASATGVNTSTNTLTETDHGLLTGDKVAYAAGSTVIDGLVDATDYYVIKVNDNSYKLATTLANARDGLAIDLNSTGVGDQTFTKAAISAMSLTKVTDNFSAITASGADVTLATNDITDASHGFVNGDMVRYHVAADGTAIEGLVDGQNYFAIVDSTSVYRLAQTWEDTQTDAVTVTINGASTDAVVVASDSIVSADHGLVDGDRVTYSNGGGTSITGLVTATNYYVIKVDDDTFKLATTKARALSGDAIDLTAVGVGGGHTFSKEAGTEIQLLAKGTGTAVFERISNEIVLSATADHDDENLTDVEVSTQRLAASSTAVDADDVVRASGSTAVESATEAYELSFDSAMTMLKGDSVTVGGLRFTAATTLSRDQIAAAFAGLYDGTTKGAGVEYGAYSGRLRGYQSSAATDGVVTFTSTTADADVQDLEIDAQAVVQGVSLGGADGNVITLTADGAKLGVADIGITVKRYSDAGVLTMTAGEDTGRGGTSQSLDLDTVASGSSKYFNFDKLGISFNLENASGAELNAGVLESQGSALSTLSVSSAMNGKALFQVGASVRDTVELEGFKDIRIGAYNKNADNTVFKNLGATLDDIAAGDLDPIDTFATLESQVEEMITSVSDFRAYFGAQQNRIDFAIANIRVQSDNMSKANSNIVDTDYAAETANLTKTQIMQQAATAMLAQANQMPNVILALLK
jgi:flagellin-like hook-associated protein FlgL